MIKLILTLSLIITLPAMAADKCSLLELAGTIRENDGDLELVVASKTMSEKVYPIDLRARPKAAPYRDIHVKGEFILDSKKILSIKKITDSLPDPLNQNESTVIKKLKDVPCPKL
ncbi:MAG: hypothetical protein ACLGHN_07000 [Bacteriovoracia bacterium]